MATHSSTLAWKIPCIEECGGLQSMGLLRVGWLSDFTFTFHFHALEKEMATHSSCLENPRDGGSWWAAVCGVAQSQTQLKQLSSSSSSIVLSIHFCLIPYIYLFVRKTDTWKVEIKYSISKDMKYIPKHTHKFIDSKTDTKQHR